MKYTFRRIQIYFLKWLLTLFRIGGSGQKGPRYQFSPETSTNVRTSPKTFWLLVLTFLPHCCKISSPDLMAVLNYWTWTKITPEKKQFFWLNPYKVEVMITSLIEMLVLPNFVHITTPTIWFESHHKILLFTSWTEFMTS